MGTVYPLEVGHPSVPGFDLRSTVTDRDARSRPISQDVCEFLGPALQVVVPWITRSDGLICLRILEGSQNR